MELAFKPEPWTERAICGPQQADEWFPEVSARDAAKRTKEFCRNCPVKAQCLDFALRNNEQFGIWGGTSVTERRLLRRAQR